VLIITLDQILYGIACGIHQITSGYIRLFYSVIMMGPFTCDINTRSNMGYTK
jgi:hypothetical protein